MIARGRQQGYLLVTVIATLFLIATVAVLVAHDSSMSANTANRDLEAARAEYVARAGLQHAQWRARNNACMGDVTIPDTPLGADSYNASVTGAANGSLVTVFADQDAWIRSDDVSTNNGKTASNHIRMESPNVEQVLTRFDLSSIPAKAQISSAVAWFHLKALKPHPEGPITIHEITADWSETAVTWESFGGAFRSGAIGVIPAQDVGSVWVAVNLTAQVQAWVNGYPNYGILFNSSDEGIHTEYMAREDATNPPRLEVVVGSGAASPVSIKAKGKLDTGVTRNTKEEVALAYQPPVGTMLQPGPSRVDDAWITAGQTAWNYGAHASLRVQPNNQQSFIRFDLAGAVPRGALVTSATLELNAYDVITSDAIDLRRVTRSWAEGSCYGNCAANDGVTWDTYDGTNTWDTPGGDVEAKPSATATPLTSNSWVAWDITDLAVDWVSGAVENDGVQILGNPGYALFHSSDALDPLLRPRLTIEYACGCGSACLAPQGSGNVLMPVTSTSNPSPGEQFRIALLESWGYTVDTTWQKNSLSNFNSAVAANDVVFVPATVDANEIGTKLTNATKGVVSELGALNDELGIASGFASPVGDSLDVVDTSHYITAVFPAGTLDIYEADMEGLTTTGSKAPGELLLANWGVNGALVALNQGAMTSSGDTAAERRVMLPFGRDGNTNLEHINNNGWLILQRSLEWAMGANAASAGKLLLVVGNAGSPAQKDIDRRDLFESWGYTVTLIDDGAGELEFKDEMLTTDVLYLTDSVSVSGFIPSLPALPTPIVSEPAGNLGPMGFSDSGNAVTYNGFTATNAGHYIGAPFGSAAVTLFTSNVTMSVASGNLAPGMQSAGELGTLTWALPTLDTGAERWDGTLSAERRVHLPFGAADVSQMTADGLTVLQRSIEWASGQGCNESTSLLFVVGDPAALTADENTRRTLLQSWCYGITLIDDDETQANIEAAAGDAKVAYVSSEVSATALGTKLRNAAVGVVSEDPDLHDEFGFSTVRFSSTTNAPLSTDAAHYITAPFAGADITLFATDQPAGAAVGTLPPGLVSVGTWTSGDLSPLGGLLTLEMGAAKSGGGTAAGRRVQLPWQGQEGGAVADISALTSDGESVLKRSLEWAAGAGCDSTTPLLFVVFEPGALSAQEIAKQNRVESWCFDVTLIDDDASQADFDTAIAANDVAYVSADAHENSVGTKLTDSTIGVVNEKARLNPDLGLASDWGSNGHDKIFVVDNAHEISTGFSTGWLTITTSSQILFSLEGTLAPGLQNLAEVWISGANYKYGLAVLETGGELWTGGSAAGRRVALPWGSGFGFTTMNANGLTLTRRALEWAADDGGPIAHWKFDDGAGSTAIDSEGGHDGTLSGNTAWTSGVIGGGLLFDDTSSLVTVPHHNALSLTTLTISAWVYSTRYHGWDAIVGKGTSGASNFGLRTHGNQVHFGFIAGGSVHELETTTANLAMDTWHHVAVTFDGASREIRIYVDGSLIDSATTTAIPETNTEPVRIGESVLGDDWEGVLDDIRLYDRVLSDTEIAALVDRPPIAHWKLDDGTGTTAIDSEGGHDGTLANGPTWVAGRLGDALEFTGGTEYVDLTSDPELDDIFVGGATVMAWINPDDWGDNGYGRILDKSSSASSTGDGWSIRLNKDNDGLNFGQGFSSGRGWWRLPTGSINLDTWQHVAIAYSADSTANDPVIYLNGTPVTVTRVDAPSGSIRSDAAINLRLGNHAGGTSHTFKGIIDDVRIYDRMLGFAEVATIAAASGGGGGGGSGNAPNFEGMSEASRDSNGTILDILKPAGTQTGDLLIAAVAVDGNEGSSLHGQAGWTPINIGESANGRVTLGLWWKIASAGEAPDYRFGWSSNEEAYGWIMRFTGHDPGSPIYYDSGALTNDNTSAPICQRLITPVDDMLVLRVGGFDDDDITIGNPGLDGHTAIAMGESGTGSGTVSGGAGYMIQTAAGDTDLAWFQLTNNEEMRTVTLGIRPAP